jgi:hypothetical protein
MNNSVYTLTLSPGETLVNLKITTKGDQVTITPIIAKETYKRGDFVAMPDGTFGIISHFCDGLYYLSFRITKAGKSIKCEVHNPYQMRLATAEEKEFILDILHQYDKYFDEELNQPLPITWRPKYGKQYYTVKVEDGKLVPVTVKWIGDEVDHELYRKHLTFKSEKAVEFFISTFVD